MDLIRPVRYAVHLVPDLFNFRFSGRIELYIMIFIIFLPCVAFGGGLPRADLVLVKKHKNRLYLIKNNRAFRVYQVALGANPKGHKQQQGDERTPEGTYILDYKKTDSAFYKAIHISYPNDRDRKKAEISGVSPGENIMIHGQKNGSKGLNRNNSNLNWTDGCIAVSNAEMDEIWSSVAVGTPIIIEP